MQYVGVGRGRVMGAWADVDAVVEQLERDMKETELSAFGPDEVVGLVRAAVDRMLASKRGASGPGLPYVDRFPIVPEDALEERPSGGRRAVAG